MSEDMKSWNSLKNFDLRKRISELKRNKEIYDAKMEGMLSMITPDSPFTEILIELVNTLRRIEDTSYDFSLENMEMINALKECLEDINLRIEKLVQLDEYR